LQPGRDLHPIPGDPHERQAAPSGDLTSWTAAAPAATASATAVLAAAIAASPVRGTPPSPSHVASYLALASGTADDSRDRERAAHEELNETTTVR
jgi:hypothetical protein